MIVNGYTSGAADLVNVAVGYGVTSPPASQRFDTPDRQPRTTDWVDLSVGARNAVAELAATGHLELLDEAASARRALDAAAGWVASLDILA